MNSTAPSHPEAELRDRERELSQLVAMVPRPDLHYMRGPSPKSQEKWSHRAACSCQRLDYNEGRQLKKRMFANPLDRCWIVNLNDLDRVRSSATTVCTDCIAAWHLEGLARISPNRSCIEGQRWDRLPQRAQCRDCTGTTHWAAHTRTGRLNSFSCCACAVATKHTDTNEAPTSRMTNLAHLQPPLT